MTELYFVKALSLETRVRRMQTMLQIRSVLSAALKAISDLVDSIKGT